MFGYNFKRKSANNVSFTDEIRDDGAVVVASGGAYGTSLDLDGTVRTEAELISKYRDMVVNPEIDQAVSNIVNDAIVDENNEPIVKIVLDDFKPEEMNPKIKKILELEFKEALRLLAFKISAHDIFARWYIDGRMYYHAIIDPEQPDLGIKELRYIDPRKIRKIREVTKKRAKTSPQDITVSTTKDEYYIYNDKGFNSDSRPGMASNAAAATGIKIAKDAIVHVVSGLLDGKGVTVLSYLHMGIKPLNQLRILEDATVIYRISRAPERRIFYIDVGNLPKLKAEQYLRDMMVKHKNRLVYDSATGEVRDDRKFLTMLEDYWFPTRGDGRGTKVDTLPAGEHLGQIDDVRYFQKRLFRALHVPISRLDEDQSTFGLGRSGEITRDEVNFSRFIDRIRVKFSDVFKKIIEKNVVLKKIMTVEEWEFIRDRVEFVYAADSYFTEMKEQEIMNVRMSTLASLDPQGPYVGKYFSAMWVRKNVLRLSDEDIEEMEEQIIEEMNDPLVNPQLLGSPDQPIEADGSNSPLPPGAEPPAPPQPPAGNSPAPAQKKNEGGDGRDSLKLQARALKLKYAGKGKWEKDGKITHVEKDGILVKKPKPKR